MLLFDVRTGGASLFRGPGAGCCCFDVRTVTDRLAASAAAAAAAAAPARPPSPEHYQICDTYAPDSDASDPGPKPNLRKPRADWAVIGKLEFSDDDGDGAQP